MLGSTWHAPEPHFFFVRCIFTIITIQRSSPNILSSCFKNHVTRIYFRDLKSQLNDGGEFILVKDKRQNAGPWKGKQKRAARTIKYHPEGCFLCSCCLVRQDYRCLRMFLYDQCGSEFAEQESQTATCSKEERYGMTIKWKLTPKASEN